MIVDVLHNPDQSLEQLLEVVSFLRADGRETPRPAGGQYIPSLVAQSGGGLGRGIE